MGASKIDIRKYLIAEGISLLFMAVLPASVICGNIVYLEALKVSDESSFTITRFAVGQLITLLFMLTMITAGIHFPSRQAMKIQPAEALHEE